MADAITTNALLLERYPAHETELFRLHPSEEGRTEHWARLHKAAWRRILQDLSMVNPAITEDDLSDSTQYIDASLYWVLHLAYLGGEGEADKAEARRWERRYQREMAEQRAKTSDGERPAGDYGTKLIRQ